MVNLIDKQSGILQSGVAQSGVLPSGKVKVPHPPTPEDRTPISVNGTQISFDAIDAETQLHPASNPGEARREAIQALIIRELLIQEAAAKKIVAEPKMIEPGKREVDEDAAIRVLLEQEVESPKADENASARYYEANKGKFASETIYEASHILIAAPTTDKKAREEAKAQTVSLLSQLQEKPELFASLALSHSMCPSREQGGNLGQLTKGSTVPEFETVLFELKEGQTWPSPVPTQFGFHIIKLERIIKGEQLPYEHVAERIGAWLEASSWSRAVSQYISILVGKAKVTGFDMKGAESPLVQ